jgi:hypothetical protein
MLVFSFDEKVYYFQNYNLLLLLFFFLSELVVPLLPKDHNSLKQIKNSYYIKLNLETYWINRYTYAIHTIGLILHFMSILCH